MKTDELMALVKQNLLVNHSEDDSLIASFVLAATSYATAYQHLPEDYYDKRSPCRRQPGKALSCSPPISTNPEMEQPPGFGQTKPMLPAPCGTQ